MNEENHCGLKEIVFHVLGQMESNSDFINHTEKCQTINTVVNCKQPRAIIITVKSIFVCSFKLTHSTMMFFLANISTSNNRSSVFFFCIITATTSSSDCTTTTNPIATIIRIIILITIRRKYNDNRCWNEFIIWLFKIFLRRWYILISFSLCLFFFRFLMFCFRFSFLFCIFSSSFVGTFLFISSLIFLF